MGFVLTAAAVVALVLGYLGGFLTFRRSLQWCGVCGAILSCPECAQRVESRRPHPVPRPRAVRVKECHR